MLSRASNLLLLASVAGCTPTSSPGAPPELASRSESVVYGDDDRVEVYAYGDEAWRALAQGSIAAMVSTRAVDASDPDDVALRGQSLGAAYDLCEGELFADQPTAASCSGTLIDDDLLLTAGHCVADGCSGDRWVFRYWYESEDRLATITAEDVFGCGRVVVSSTSGWGGGEGPDYAVVQLDRAATPRHTPAEFNLEASPVAIGDPVTMIGFGSGLPAKIDDGGAVTAVAGRVRNTFSATVDAFGGHSGSGVFDADRRVVGILVSGEQDYARDGGCTRVNTLDEGGSAAESVTYAILAVEALCAEGWPSARLCNIAPSCGDGVCSLGETFDTCPDDCDEVLPVPAGWTCESEYYAVGDDCDCGCGVYDPDCDDPSLRTVNCRRGQVCSAGGTCVDPGAVEPDPEVPAAWTCDDGAYAADDGCDCLCGAADPDCADPSQELYNCPPGSTCSDTGVCVPRGGGSTEPGGDGPSDPADAGRADTSDSTADTATDAAADGATEDSLVFVDTTEPSGCAVSQERIPSAWLMGMIVGWALVPWRRHARRAG